MKVHYGRLTATEAPGRSRVTLGTFDGVHLGHQRVLRELIVWARAEDCPAFVVTFDRIPRNALGNDTAEEITCLPHRLMLFERLGIDGTLVLSFDEPLATMEPETFVRDVLVKQLRAGGVLLGHDTRFGRGARGDIRLMETLGREMGFETCSVPVVKLDGEPISSTRVRQAVSEGNLRLAERMLGRRVSVLGKVISGTMRGRSIGCPTANLNLHHEFRPPEGVYATRTLVDGVLRDSITNIGRPPSLQADGPRYLAQEAVVETHLLDFRGDLYGKEIEVRFVDMLRPERVFDSKDALARQIAEDIAAARQRLAATKPYPEQSA